MGGVAVVQAACGPLHAIALGDRGDVFTWGRIAGAFGKEVQLQLVPKLVDAIQGVTIVQVATGGEHALALSDEGEVYAWGAHASGALGSTPSGSFRTQYLPVHKAELGIGKIREIACGRCHSVFLSDSSDDAESHEKLAELWLCGMGVTATEHPASQSEGVPATRAGGWQSALAPPAGVPLKLSRIEVKRVLDVY